MYPEEKLSDDKRARIEQWIARSLRSLLTVQSTHYDNLLCHPETLNRSTLLQPKEEKFYFCRRPSCPAVCKAFEELQKHCLDTHQLYICLCGMESKHKFTFTLHAATCKKIS